MGHGMPIRTEPAKLKQATFRRHVWLSPEARAFAPILAAVRALLLEERINAWADYLRLLALAKPHIEKIEQRTRADMGVSRRALDTRQDWLGTDFIPGFQDIADRLAEYAKAVLAFGDKWLYESQAGCQAIQLLVAMDYLGIDPLAIDTEKAQSNPVWHSVYGNLTNRPSRRRHREIMLSLKSQGWRRYDDDAMLRKGKAWVQIHHVYHGLTAYVKATIPDALTDDISKQSQAVRPIDEALGKERKTGMLEPGVQN